MIVNRSLFLLSVIIIISSCAGKNISGERFSTYYKIEDTVSLYDMEIFARFDRPFEVAYLPLKIKIIAPSGESYEEMLNLPVFEADIVEKMVQNGKWTDFLWNYRSGVSFSVSGKWRFVIERSEIAESVNIEDAGVVIRNRRAKYKYGKR